jgi:hypothetical protein
VLSCRTWRTKRCQAPTYAAANPVAGYEYGYEDIESNRRHLFEQGGGQYGSRPHLVHELMRSIIERRSPAGDAVTDANWTAAGICAYESALQGGAEVEIPRFDMP